MRVQFFFLGLVVIDSMAVKHGAAKTMVWGCFSYYGVGPIYRIPGIMDQFEYIKILEGIMLPYAEEEMSLKWVFQEDNDPKHTSK